MAGRVVLVTGVTRFVGSALAGRLASTPGIARVIGVDATLPEPAARARMGSAEFARADIRNPLIARVLDAAGVDTVVHASASSNPAGARERRVAKEMNVLGTMQLLGACQRADSVRSLIVRSTTAVYGYSPRDPAVFDESTEARSVPSTGPARDAIDIEGYVRGFARRRPDVRVVVPRLAELIGPTVQTPLTRYLGLTPVIPVPFGHDARLQLLHESDAVGALAHLVDADFAGTVNVAGEGVLMLSQAVHRAGRVPIPVPVPMLNRVSALMRALRFGAFSAEQVRMLMAGRVVDVDRLHHTVGYRAQFSTVAAFDDFARTLTPVLDAETVRRAETTLGTRLGAIAPLPTEPASTDEPRRPHLVGIAGEGRDARPPSTARRRRT